MITPQVLAEFEVRLRPGLRGHLYTNAPMSEWVNYRIGGPADLLLEPRSEEDLTRAIQLASELGVPVTIIGSGTNLLVRDGGIRGLVLALAQKGIDPQAKADIAVISETKDTVRVRVPAYCAKATLLEWSLEKGYAGLEFSAGIPGTLGGAVFMNAGTKWGSYGDVLKSVRFYSADKGFYERPAEEMGFKYRGHGEGLFDGKTIVWSAELELKKNKLRREILNLVDEILTYRGGKQPLELPNCGSVFKNPENSVLGAGRLVEACALKGLTRGGAQVSLKHANFIQNLGDAKAADVEWLIREIQRTVLEQKKVVLETEVITLGEE